MRKNVEQLIKQAERDIQNAEKNIRIEAYEVAAFLIQQSIEKYLKAAYMHLKSRKAPLTHSLVELGNALNIPREYKKKLAYLTPDYIISRYPDAANALPYEIYDRETVEGKLSDAKRVISWLKRRIKG